MRNLFICALTITLTYAQTPYTINLFVKEYPSQKLASQPAFTEPLLIPKQIMKSTFYQPVISGVYGLYNGYLSQSNRFGLLSFPRKTQREQFTLVVTPTLKPTFLLNNTINNWHILDPKNSAMFQVKRIKDPETKLFYWKVQQTNIPHDNAIPLHSVILLAKAKNIYIPLGVSLTKNLPNLVLPTIYAKRGLDHIKQAFFVLKIKQFFAPVKTPIKRTSTTRDTIITA